MKTDDFRRIALSLPEASESVHIGHPDFRVGEKIFATLGYPNEETGVIMLPPDEQERLIQVYRGAFGPTKRAWGRRGNTRVALEAVDTATLGQAMVAAWSKKAPA